MSYKFAWEAALLDRAQLGPTGTAVALCALHFANGEGQDIYPSITRLCAMLGRPGKPASRHTVIKWLQVLVDYGWLIVVRPGTRTSTTHYRLNIPGGAGDAPLSSPEVVHEMHQGSAGDAPQVVHEMHQGGARDALNQTIEQTISTRPVSRARAREARAAVQAKPRRGREAQEAKSSGSPPRDDLFGYFFPDEDGQPGPYANDPEWSYQS